MRAAFSLWNAKQLQQWSTAEVVEALAKRQCNKDLVDGFRIQRISGQMLFEQETQLFHRLSDQSSNTAPIEDEVLMEALLKTAGYSCKK